MVKFPLLGVFLLIVGLVWLLDEISYLNLNLPWIPTILIVIAVAMIWNRFFGKK